MPTSCTYPAQSLPSPAQLHARGVGTGPKASGGAPRDPSPSRGPLPTPRSAQGHGPGRTPALGGENASPWPARGARPGAAPPAVQRGPPAAVGTANPGPRAPRPGCAPLPRRSPPSALIQFATWPAPGPPPPQPQFVPRAEPEDPSSSCRRRGPGPRSRPGAAQIGQPGRGEQTGQRSGACPPRSGTPVPFPPANCLSPTRFFRSRCISGWMGCGEEIPIYWFAPLFAGGWERSQVPLGQLEGGSPPQSQHAPSHRYPACPSQSQRTLRRLPLQPPLSCSP